MDLMDNVVVVTGASRGIGLACATRFAQAGAHLVLFARNGVSQATVAALRQYGQEVLVQRGDIADPEAAAALITTATAHFGRLDVLINNAGITEDGLAMRMTPAQFAHVLAVNLQGTFNVSQPAFKAMMKNRRGVIINMSSVVGLTGNVGQANYAAAKAGVIGLTKALAKEGALRGVRVNAIAPGMIATQMTETLSSSVKANVLQAIPLGRFGQPEEVASAAEFLAANDYITGQTLTVDGGLAM